MQVASLVLGILGLMAGWIPITGLVLAAISLILGLISVKRAKAEKQPTGLGTAGSVLGAIGVVAGLMTLAFYVFANDSEDPATVAVQPASSTVESIDGGLMFVTTSFSCATIIETGGNWCTLAFSVTDSPETEPAESLAIDYRAASLVGPLLAAEDLGPDAEGGVFLDQGSVEYGPNNGSCSSDQIQPPEAVDCQAFFGIDAGSQQPDYVIYRASVGSDGARITLPSPTLDEPVDQQTVIEQSGL